MNYYFINNTVQKNNRLITNLSFKFQWYWELFKGRNKTAGVTEENMSAAIKIYTSMLKHLYQAL